MAMTRKNTAQPFAKGMGARTISSALSAATKGSGAMANPQDPNRELQRAGKRAGTAGKLADMLKSKAGAVPMKPANVPGKGMEPTAGSIRSLGAAASKAPARPENVSTTREGDSRAAKAPVQKTYTSKGEINQTGNARNGKDYATFTVAGKDGEYHEYVDPKTKKRKVVRVAAALKS